MSRSLSMVLLFGNVGAEPEAITTSTGVTLVKCSLATNRRYKDRAGEPQEETELHHPTFFGSLAEVVGDWVHKSDRLYVEGRIQGREREDDEGRARRYYNIIMNELGMLGSKGGAL